MRLCISVFSLLLLCLFPLDAQQEYAESYIHISASVSLAEALDEIESQTNYSFIYDARVINLSEKLRSPLSGRTVFEILNLLFKDRTIVYTVMNDQVILSVTKRGGGLGVTTRGTGHDQLAAIEAVAASAWRVMTANRNVPPDAATGVILLSVQRGIQTAAGKSKQHS